MILLEVLSGVCLVSGGFLCVTGALGLLRFPDFYTRLHAAGVIDTLGSALIILGLMMHPAANMLVIAKLSLLLLFLFITIPTASHALSMAAVEAGLKPLLRDRHARRGLDSIAEKQGGAGPSKR